MKCLTDMRQEMENRRSQNKQAVLEQLNRPRAPVLPPNPTIGRIRESTPVAMASQVAQVASPTVPPPPPPSFSAAKPITKAQTEAMLKGGAALLVTPIPDGYRALSKHDADELYALRDAALALRLISWDFETDADQDEGVDILNDKMVGMSFSFQSNTAFYIPVGHDSYGANWDVEAVIEAFRPLWESEEVLKIAFNIKFEHQMLLRYGVRMPYVNVADPMIMVQMTACLEEVALKSVVPHILPYLFDKFGDSVLLESYTHEELAPYYIASGDENQIIADPDRDGYSLPLAEWKERKQRELFWDAFVTPFREITKVTVQDGVYKSGKNKGTAKTKVIRRSFNEMPMDKKTVGYGCKDSDWALQVYLALKPMLDKDNLMVVHDLLDCPFMMVLGEVELQGWRVEPELLHEMYAKADKVLNEEVHPELEKELYALIDLRAPQCVEIDNSLEKRIIVPSGSYAMGKWRRKDVFLEIKTAKVFNWGSTQHLQWLFYHVLGFNPAKLEISRSGKTGLPSTGEDDIDKLIYANPNMPLFRSLLKLREYKKMRDTYAKALIDAAREGTNRVHASLRLVSTWRLACKGPNLQNIPRLDNDNVGIRKTFIAPPGRTLVSCDYSQIELRVMAYYARDKAMKDAFYKGQDLHSRVAKEVWKLDCAVEEVKKKYKAFRYRAKAVNFGICYGSTEYGLHATLNEENLKKAVTEGKQFEEVPLSECATIISNYKATFPGIVTYAMEQISFARANGYVETIFGHRRPIPQINHANEWVRKKEENKCMNTPIQGSASDIIRLAMVNLAREFRRRASFDPRWRDVYMVMQIHDDLLVECPIEMAVEVARVVKEVMEWPINSFLQAIGRGHIDFDVPIVGDPAIGRVWANVLDVSIDEEGRAKVHVKEKKSEALDITLDDLTDADMQVYRGAGIEVWRGETRVA